MNKEAFLKTEFAAMLQSTITEWDRALEEQNRGGDDEDIERTLSVCQAKYEVYRAAIKNTYGVEYHFSRTEEYYGLCTGDGSDWLMKFERKGN